MSRLVKSKICVHCYIWTQYRWLKWMAPFAPDVVCSSIWNFHQMVGEIGQWLLRCQMLIPNFVLKIFWLIFWWQNLSLHCHVQFKANSIVTCSVANSIWTSQIYQYQYNSVKDMKKQSSTNFTFILFTKLNQLACIWTRHDNWN